MGIKIKNLQTGEFEKFNIPALKGEKGEPGEIESSEKVDYIGKQHSKLRDTMNANVDYIIKTAIGEFNYLDYEGQRITATNSIEGHARSAILSGSTKYQIGEFIQDVYASVQQFKTGYYLGHEDGTLIQGGNEHKYCEDYAPLPTGVTSITSKGSSNWKKLCCYDSNKNFISGANGNNGLDDLTLNIPSNAKYFRYSTNTAKGENEYINVVSNTGLLLASSNYNIPCELISCKMPVLTTTGKNLYVDKGGKINSDIVLHTGLEVVGNRFIPNSHTQVSPGETHTLYRKNATLNIGIRFYDINKKYIPSTNSIYSSTNILVFKTPSDCYYIRFIDEYNKLDNTYAVYLGDHSSSFEYEPCKSNILTTPSDLELRGIGNVKDELNVMTGEVVERVGEVVLNGSESWGTGLWSNQVEGIGFEMKIKNDVSPSVFVKAISNKFLYDTSNNFQNDGEYFDMVGAGNGETWIRIRILRSKLSTEDIEGFKKWLSQNNVKILYELSDKPIKTVDLSDNHVYSYKGITHYSCSSEEWSLVPTLSIKVPTDTQLTIQEQKATTQTLLIKNMDLQQSIKEVQAMNLAFNTALYNSFNSIREEVEDIKKHVSTNENLEGSF